jgi:hypothetical protein
MSAGSLDGNLPVVDGKLTLAADTLPGSRLGELLTLYNGDAPLVIKGARKQSTADAVTVKGTCDFMNAAALPVVAVFTEDGGAPAATLRFTLIGDAPGPDAWRFSRSFPQLPLFTDMKYESQPVFLDTLALSDSDFVLTTLSELTDEATGAALAFGLNFVGTLKPASVLGLFGTLLGVDEAVTLYGPITAPKPAEGTAPPLNTVIYPWDATWRVPGISLRADLGINMKVAGSNLLFHKTELRIYSPTSEDWLEENWTYVPTRALSGTLDVPSAGISAEMTARLLQHSRGMTLTGIFTGLSLDNLAKLFDLVGGGDLFDFLPDDIKKYGDALGGLSLTAASLSFEDNLTPTAVGLTVGMPNVQTSVLSFFVIESVFANFFISDPFSDARSVGVTLSGTMDVAGKPFGVLLDVSNLLGRATLKQDAMLPLSDLFDEIGLTSPSDLSVQMMDMWVSPTQSYSFEALMAGAPAWELDLGPVPMLISDVHLAVDLLKGGSIGGAFGGTLEFSEELSLSMNYTLPGSFVVRAEFPSVKLSQLIARLDEIGINLPAGFDVDFGHSYLNIEKQNGDLTFNAAAEVENFGLLAFTAQKQGEWGFAYGLDLEAGGLSSIKGLEALAAFESFVGLDEIMLVASSLSQPGFTFPAMSNFNAPALGEKGLRLPPQASGLVNGLNVYASLNTGKSAAFKALAKYLGVKLDGTVGITLGVSLPDPAANSKLFLSLNQQLQKGVQLVGEFGLLMQGGEVGLFLVGDVKAKVQDQPVEFSVSALALENGVVISGTMAGTVKFGSVSLSDLALIIGMDFEGVPSLGIAATLALGKFQSSLAIFFDSTDPSRSLLAGAVSDLTLKDVLDTFAGSVIPSDIDKALEKVALVGTSDFNISADTATALDNLQTDAVAAAFAKAGVTIPSSSSQVHLNVSKPGARWLLTDMSSMLHYELVKTAGGIRVTLEPQFYCAPQTTFIGALRFEEGTFFNAGLKIMSFGAEAKVVVKASKGVSVDGRMSRVVIGTEALFCIEAAEGKQGPRVSAATFKQPELQDATLKEPHFLLDGSLTLLGLKQSTYVSLTDKGFNFFIKGALKPGLKDDLPGDFSYDLNGHFNGPKDLGAGGSLNVSVGAIDLGQLGKVKVDSGVTGQFDAGVNDSQMWAKFAGGFELAGEKLTLPKVDLDVKSASLLKLPRKLAGMVKDALNGVFKDAAKWAKHVRSGVVAGVTDVGGVLKSAYNMTAEQATKVMRDAGYTANEVGNALKSAYGATAQQTAQWLKGVGYAADQVGGVMKSAYGATAQQATQLLRGAGYTANEIGGALKSVYGLTVQQAAQLLRGVGYTAEQIGGALKSVYGSSANEAAQLLRGAGYNVTQVGGALVSAYGATADTSAAALKGAGYAVDEVGSFVKDTYKLGAKQLGSVLKGAGYTTNQIKGFFNSLGGKFKDLFDDVGDKLDPTKW